MRVMLVLLLLPGAVCAADLARAFAECAGRFAAEAGFAARYERRAFDALELEREAFEALLESAGGGHEALKNATADAHEHLLDVAALSFDEAQASRAENLLEGYRATCRGFIPK